MDRQVVSVTADTDQEAVAQLFRKYDLVSLPVTDPRGALLGRITVDDVVDVLEEEASEDFAKLSGLGQEEPLFDSPLRAIRRRLPWLGLNLVTTTVSASVIGFFQGTIQTVAIAAALMTIVAAQGGNAGVQTLTVMVRGLALGQVTLVRVRAILFKEFVVASGNGLALGLVAGVGAYLLHGQALLAVVLGLALLVNYLVAAVVASVIPLTLHWLRADPAVASSVFVTACTDLCGFFAFLGLLAVALRHFG
jgi:magnesium transporter